MQLSGNYNEWDDQKNKQDQLHKSFLFAKNKLSNGLKGYLISRYNFIKIGIGMLFLLEKKIGIDKVKSSKIS